MSGPILAVRVAANVEELKRNLQDGVVNQVEIVRSSLQKMVNAYDPQVLINKAAATAAAIQQVGGASMLSADQQARANRVLDEGIAAFGRIGEQAPRGILAIKAALDPTIQQQHMLGEKITITADQMAMATGRTDSLRSAYGQFDNILQAVGINIGSQAKGLFDIAEASGKTTAMLGPLATAGLAAGAAFAGWNIGRWIADITGADAAISKLTASVLGYGDVAAETVAAKQDVINRAIAQGAPLTITYAQAVQFNARAHQEAADAYEVTGQKMSDVQKAARSLSDATRDGIMRAKEAGASEEAIHRHYNVSVDVIKEVIRVKNLSAEASDKLKKKTEEEAAAVEKMNAAYRDYMNWLGQRRMEDDHAAMIKRKTDAAEGWYQAMLKIAGANRQAAESERAFIDEQQRVEDENKKIIESLGATGAAHTKAGADGKAAADGSRQAYAGLTQQITLTGDALKEVNNLMRYAAEANAILGRNGLYTSQGQREAIAALPRREMGGPVSAGQPYIVGERRAEVFVPERSGAILPSVGGGNVTLAPVLNFHGPVMGSAREFQVMVEAALLNVYRSAGNALPSPS